VSSGVISYVLLFSVEVCQIFWTSLDLLQWRKPSSPQVFTGQDVTVVFTRLNIHSDIIFCTGACLEDSGFTDALTGLGPL